METICPLIYLLSVPGLFIDILRILDGYFMGYLRYKINFSGFEANFLYSNILVLRIIYAWFTGGLRVVYGWLTGGLWVVYGCFTDGLRVF